MFVIKRNGNKEQVQFDKITKRIEGVCQNIFPKLLNVDPIKVAQKTIEGIYDGIKTSEIDTLSSEISAYMSTLSPEYDDLAARIMMSNIQKDCPKKFSDCVYKLHNYTKNGRPGPLINKKVYDIIMSNKDLIDNYIVHNRDFLFNYFGLKTLEKSYLKKLDNIIIETPQYMFMRVCIGIHHEDLKSAFEAYDLISQHYYVPATPTLFNSGGIRPQLSSCFLLTMKEDSIEGIFDTVKQTAEISKSAGGIGLSIHNIRSTGSNILGTGGKSNGIVPMIKVFNEVAKYVDQCLTPDTLVHTDEGRIKVSDLINENVYTTNGLRKINSIKKLYHNGEIVIINVRQNVGKFTPFHPLLISDNKGVLYFKYAIEIRKGDLVCFPYNFYSDPDLIYNNRYFYKVDHVSKWEYTGPVYDLEIDTVHNYLTDVGIVHNGGGLRKGAFAIYLEPHHPDIFDFLDLKKNTGAESQRARDLFYALWVPDEFMRRVENDDTWTLICPSEAPELCDLHGEEFTKRYKELEIGRPKIKARDLWAKIIDSQIETGMPYILFKDTCQKSNQSNLGTIRNSNLCAEIVQYCSKDEISVCNLSSIALPKFVKDNSFDFDHFFETVQIVVKNLNKVIDVNYYPVKEAELSNKKHRPVGLGVQGLADLFIKLKLPFESKEARDLNKKIFETLYYSAIDASVDLAKKHGSYESFIGSPMSKGIFQFDMYNEKPSNMWDFNYLKDRVMKYGLRNSLLISLQPTASTSSILGNTESFEPITNNIYNRRVLSGEFIIVNRYLFNDLKDIWSAELKNKIIANNGSIQNIEEIPESIKKIYKNVWEISQKAVIDMASDRQRYICQSQSMNIYLQEPSHNKITSMLFYGWKKGLKTGLYYLRTQPAVSAIKFTLPGEMPKEDVCYMKDGCISCT